MSHVKKYDIGQIRLDLLKTPGLQDAPYMQYTHELPLLSFGDVQHSVNLSLVFNYERYRNEKAAGENPFFIAPAQTEPTEPSAPETTEPIVPETSAPTEPSVPETTEPAPKENTSFGKFVLGLCLFTGALSLVLVVVLILRRREYWEDYDD